MMSGFRIRKFAAVALLALSLGACSQRGNDSAPVAPSTDSVSLTAATPTSDDATPSPTPSPDATTSPAASPTVDASNDVTPVELAPASSCDEPVTAPADWRLAVSIQSTANLGYALGAGYKVGYYNGPGLGNSVSKFLSASKCNIPVLYDVDSDLNRLGGNKPAQAKWLRHFIGRSNVTIVVDANRIDTRGRENGAAVRYRVGVVRYVLGHTVKVMVAGDAHHTASRSANIADMRQLMSTNTDGYVGQFYPHGYSQIYGSSRLIDPSAKDMVTVAGNGAIAEVQGFAWSLDPRSQRKFHFRDTERPRAKDVAADVATFKRNGVDHAVVNLFGQEGKVSTWNYARDINNIVMAA